MFFDKLISFYKNKKRLFWLIFILFVLLVILALFLFYPNKNGNSTYQDYVKNKKTNQTTENNSENKKSSVNDSDKNISSNTPNSSSPNQNLDSTEDEGTSSQPPTSPTNYLTATVGIYSDSQSDTDSEDLNHSKVVDYLINTSANPIFHAGDLLEDGTQDSLIRFNAVSAPLRAVRSFYSAQGNNERNSSIYFNNFTYPGNEHYYSINTGNLHMIVLDNYALSVAVGSPQYNWLLSDLQTQTSQDKITGVIFHYPPYGYNGDTKGLISTIIPLFKTYGVDFVISGHEHLYQHEKVDGIHYFVCSGQPSLGYMIAKIYENSVNITAYNKNNALIESTSFDER